MRVLINAPAGTARLSIESGKFTSMFSDTRFFPACRVESFSEREIRISETKSDEIGGSDGFHFTVEWEPLLKTDGKITAVTTAGATMVVQRGDGGLVRLKENDSQVIETWSPETAGQWMT